MKIANTLRKCRQKDLAYTKKVLNHFIVPIFEEQLKQEDIFQQKAAATMIIKKA